MDVNKISAEDNVPIQNQQPQKKKCHGNRKDQRFRKKLRTRGINPEKIEKKLARRKQIEQKKNSTMSNVKEKNNSATRVPTSTSTRNQPTTTTTMLTTTSFNKRKRDISLQELITNETLAKSSTSITTVKRLSKKPKQHDNKKLIDLCTLIINNDSMIRKYRRPLFLTRPSSKLFRILKKRLNYSLRKPNRKEFIYKRLNLFDQQYYLEIEQRLWQSYLDIGLKEQMWPEILYKMAKTSNDTNVCHDFLVNYLENIKNQINKCQLQLNEQSHSCPITRLTIDQIDHCLKEYVHTERSYLTMRNNDELIQFKSHIREKDLLKTITSYQIKMDLNEYLNRLISIREQRGGIWKDCFMLQMRILFKFLPQNFDHLEKFIGSIHYLSLDNTQNGIEIKNKRYKLIQEAKRTWLNTFFNVYEYKLQKCEQQYQNEMKQLETQLLDINITKDGESVLNKIKEYISTRTNRIKQEIDDQMSSARGLLLQKRHQSSSAKHMIGVSPEPYLDLIENPFNRLQWNQLSLGPSYIRLNQSGIRRKKEQLKQAEKEHKGIYKKVESNLIQYPGIPRKASVFKQYSTNLLNHVRECYLTPLSYKDFLEAQQQSQIARSIRSLIKEKNLIIRLTDKGHNFYIGSASEFEKKAQKFFSDTNAFMELSENPFNEITNKVIQFLNRLHGKKIIQKWHYEQMMPDPKKCELAHLYFNPKTHKENIPVRPIENTIHAPTTNISKFLDKYLQPIFNDKCKDTNIIDGAFLIEGLHKYIRKGLFKSTTLFCTFDIRNLYTMLPQDEALDILIEFLQFHGYTKVKGIDLEIIRQLAAIVLKENVFVYDKKIYKQTTGGAMGSTFTLTLANIFMWKWQKEFVRQQDITNEFYGRYIDDVFITWNRSENELQKLLDRANIWHPNIKLDYKIGKCLPFLDILLTNNNGILLTTVYHKPAAEPYVTPFLSDHPRHVFQNIIQNTLTKAIRYSSTYEAFQNEQCLIRLKLLYNDYQPTFIDKQFSKFLIATAPSISTFLSTSADEQQYKQLRNQILRKPTQHQSQVALAIATAELQNYPKDEETAQGIKKNDQEQKKDTTNLQKKIIVHYTHEKRLHSFKRDMHHILDKTFSNQLSGDIRLIVGNRNRRDAKKELIRKRPKHFILKNKV